MTNHRVSDEMNRTAQTVAEATERAARASAEIVQRNTQIVQQAWEMSSKMAAQLTQQSGDQLARAFGISGEPAQQSALNLDAIIGPSAALAEGVLNISREWLEFAQSRVEKNGDWCNALVRCRTPQDLTAVQSEMIQTDLQQLLQSARRTAEMSAQTADKATRKLAERMPPARQAA
jgi:hypothetical protein